MDKKNSISKGITIFFMFLLVFIIFLLSKAPTYFDSYVLYTDYKFKAHVFLFLYRFLIYFSFPFIITFFEKLKKSKNKFSKLLLNNFNIQFITYSIMAGIYALFGFDKIFGVDIFNSADAFLFVTGFVFSIILKKKISKPLE